MNFLEDTPYFWPARIALSCLSLYVGYRIWKHFWGV